MTLKKEKAPEHRPGAPRDRHQFAAGTQSLRSSLHLRVDPVRSTGRLNCASARASRVGRAGRTARRLRTFCLSRGSWLDHPGSRTGPGIWAESQAARGPATVAAMFSQISRKRVVRSLFMYNLNRLKGRGGESGPFHRVLPGPLGGQSDPAVIPRAASPPCAGRPPHCAAERSVKRGTAAD